MSSSAAKPPTKEGTNAALAVRYICVVGLVLLLTDYIASIRQERELIWRARPSVTKYIFLLNRYLIPACLVVIYLPLSGFLGLDFSTSACGWIIVTVAAVLAVCIVLDCLLAAMRLSMLWDNSRSMNLLMAIVAAASYIPHIAMILFALGQMRTSIIWNPIILHDAPIGLNMCTATYVSKWLIGASAAPLLFEFFMLFAVSRKLYQLPRKSSPSLKDTVGRDGVIFFVGLIALRILHLVLVATLDPALVLIGVLSITVTSLLSILSNYRLLASKSAAFAEQARRATKSVPLTPSVYGLRGRRNSSGESGDVTKGGWPPSGDAIELGRVHMDVQVQSETKVVVE